ncbi:short-chain dehydrogenase [Paenibacillus selenitireducens]|uniref:Short-chain dehydrogenase n=1 Tax=Paenibacillus selenitireducens TaxID=1324314 RepID=A0A1T2XL36_9BACL|nr:SDR family NAD(P)-dependent oxidoreductase [Paenibacillus selenitireducens]OPA80528.1 short-chain dehydrogenase [Paenibacillus selenitireducens]
MSLQGKVCIVTGGGSGIGEVTVKRFASEGATVIIADVNEQGAQRVVHEILRHNGSASVMSVRTDVSDDREVRSLVTEVISQYGHIDVLFNNAATILPKALEEVSEHEWTRVIDINLKSVYLMIKYTIPYLRVTRGSIVNMASLNGLVGQKQNAVYAATKGGIIAMTKALAIDYAPEGVRVNCICPAGVMTPLLEKWTMEQADPEEVRTSLNEMHALGRPARAEEISDAVVFLASQSSQFITGVALPVDGGASLGY